MGGGWGALGSKVRDAGRNRCPPQRAHSLQSAQSEQSAQSGQSEQSGGMGSAQPDTAAGPCAWKGDEDRELKRPARNTANDAARGDPRNDENGESDDDESDDDDLKPMFLRQRKM